MVPVEVVADVRKAARSIIFFITEMNTVKV